MELWTHIASNHYLFSFYWEGLWGKHSGLEGAQYRKKLFKQMGAE